MAQSIAPYPPIGLGNTICALGDAAALPVHSFVVKFRQEFEEHIRAGKCPFGEKPWGHYGGDDRVTSFLFYFFAHPHRGRRARGSSPARSPIYSAMSLVGTFFFLAGDLRAPAGAHTIAVLQVLVYAGAIMVLFLFVIMLLALGDAGGPGEGRPSPGWWAASPRRGSSPCSSSRRGPFVPAGGAGTGQLRHAPGNRTRSSTPQWLLPFEAVSLLLLVAMVGAVWSPSARSLNTGATVEVHRTLQHYLFLAALLFCLGMFGVLVRRNALVVFMCVELMLNAANLTFLAFAARLGDMDVVTSAAFFVIAVAAAEAAIGLAIVIAVFRSRGTVTSTTSRR